MKSEAAKAKKKFLEKTLARLNRALVLVEGKRDASALWQIGVGAKVLEAGGRKPEQGVAAALAALKPGQKIVLLFDYDAEGERKAAEFSERLCAAGVVPDGVQRKNFRRLFGARAVEEAVAALEKIEKEFSEKR
ncbi:MAG: toprim domain-containing protein [Candidatus Micrarchaeota archaeon]